MRILLTNDDGIDAVCLSKLAFELSKAHEVYIVAPCKEQSGAGHSLSFTRKINCKQRDLPCEQVCKAAKQCNSDEHDTSSEFCLANPYTIPCWEVDGSPSDCVKFAIECLYRDTKFDLVLSGINTVLNVGTDIVYSGTFNAAEEGTILGIKSIAVSTVGRECDYSFPIKFVVDNLEQMVGIIPDMATLNVNIPFANRERNNGIAVVPIGLRRYNDWYEETADGYKLVGYPLDCSNNESDDDAKWIDKGYITVSLVRVISPDADLHNSIDVVGWKL